jgi:hypothetical protein
MGFLGVDANTRTIAAGDQDTLAPAQPETDHRVAHGAGGGTDGKGHDLWPLRPSMVTTSIALCVTRMSAFCNPFAVTASSRRGASA